MRHLIILILPFLFIACGYKSHDQIIIVGGGASGVAASVQAARQGVKVTLIESSEWLGGMLSSAGVSAVDGNYNLPSGFFGEFRDSLIAHYGTSEKLKTGWVSNVMFEPSVANQIFKSIVQQEKNIEVLYDTKVVEVKKGSSCYDVTIERDSDVKTIRAKVLIDATELGDVAASLSVPYDLGMESRYVTHEDIAPEKANDIIQDLTYVAILKDYGRDMSMPMPEGYNPNDFACCCVNDLCVNPKEPNRMWAKDKMITYGKLPNDKYMINWPIEGNDYYTNLVEKSEEEREAAIQQAKNFTLKFIYFIQQELGYKNLYLADDEFPTEDHLPLIPYHRESRRIYGKVRFTLNDIVKPYEQDKPLYRTCIGVGDYPVDQHHTRYSGWSDLPNLYFHPVPSYGLPMGTLLPNEPDNFIVAEKSISVSNLVNGTTRLQPVVLQIGQAAGTIAAIAVNKHINVSEVSVRDVQDVLLDSKCYLLPYLDVDINHPRFKALQRMGATGILKGVGKNVHWSNQTWIYADSVLYSQQLDGLNDVYKGLNYSVVADKMISRADALAIVDKISVVDDRRISDENKMEVLQQLYKQKDIDYNLPIRRGEFAVLIDFLLDPFHSKPIDIQGKVIR